MPTDELEPSPTARKVFGMMVAHSDDLHLTLAQSINVSVHLLRAGEDPGATVAITELMETEWISPLPDGGWLLQPVTA